MVAERQVAKKDNKKQTPPQKKVKREKKQEKPVTRELTINIHKRIHKVGIKKRAPRAVKEIKKFAQKLMGTEDVRVDQGLNKFMWSKGIRNVPYRVRVQLSKKPVEDEDSEHQFYTVVTHVPVLGSYKGLLTKTIEE
eukprot:c8326_g1_i1.p1 GENE.c8326_g1_i1~~c8326_g1_i1.p1  ORF type:complete len:137 (-),score=37.50 c8326_g1_i1:160-570(-)